MKYFFVFFLCWITAKNQNIKWQLCLGGENYDESFSIQKTIDNGLIIAGSSSSCLHGFGLRDFVVFKLNREGAVEWQKCYGGSNHDIARSIKQTNDSGYVIVGYTYSNNHHAFGNHGETDILVIKTNKSGDVQWSKCIGGDRRDEAFDIIETYNGDYVLVGFSASNNNEFIGNHGGGDFLVVFLDRFGNEKRKKLYGGSEDECAYKIIQTSEKNFVICGSSSSKDGDFKNICQSYHNYSNIFVLKIDSIGEISWLKCFGGSGFDEGYEIKQTFDKGFVIVGTSSSNEASVRGNHGLYDYYFLKLDSLGNIQNQKYFGGSRNDFAYSVLITADKGYLIAGSSSSVDGNVGFHYAPNFYNSDAWLLKLDSLGNIQWQKCFGGSKNDGAYSVVQISPNDFVFTGYTASNDEDVNGFHGGLYDIWVVNFYIPLGNFLLNFNNFIDFKSDDSGEFLIIDVYDNFYYLKIINHLGQVIYEKKLEDGTNKINLNFLPEGTYFVSLENLKTFKKETKKIMIKRY